MLLWGGKRDNSDLFLAVGDLRGVDDDDEKPTIDSQGKHIPVEGEPDFVETNCHWENCSLEFPTQDDLVKVNLL